LFLPIDQVYTLIGDVKFVHIKKCVSHKKISISIANTPNTLSRGIKVERGTENRILCIAYCEKRQNSLEKIVTAENNNNSASIIRRYVDFREEKGQNCWEKPAQSKQQVSSSQ